MSILPCLSFVLCFAGRFKLLDTSGDGDLSRKELTLGLFRKFLRQWHLAFRRVILFCL